MDENVKRVGKVLEDRIPLLTQYSPDGWQDFRDGTPATLRCGLFVNTEDAHPGAMVPPLSVDRPTHGCVRWKTLVGSEMLAQSITQQLSYILPRTAFAAGPMTRKLDTRWLVEWAFHPESMDLVREILDPAPPRPFPHSSSARVQK